MKLEPVQEEALVEAYAKAVWNYDMARSDIHDVPWRSIPELVEPYLLRAKVVVDETIPFLSTQLGLEEEVLDFQPRKTPVYYPECKENWPGCYTGGFDPSCCRWPKSCSSEDIEATEAQPEPERVYKTRFVTKWMKGN